MDTNEKRLAQDAERIWRSAVEAVKPELLVRQAFLDTRYGLGDAVEKAGRILVIGAGKAGAAMAAGLEEALANRLDHVAGHVNVPENCVRRLRAVELWAARPAGSNHPTAEGVEGTGRLLDLVRSAKPDDLCICLLSGGGSALMPAPVAGITLADKQAVTRLLHARGATIDEMNCVRKHLSRVKGGQLARAFKGRALYCLILSDVVGDPLDVIASGPTSPDPTTFADALAVLEKYTASPSSEEAKQLEAGLAPSLNYLEEGIKGRWPETPKALPGNVHNIIVGNNETALAVAQRTARELGYNVLNLGSYLEGETAPVAVAMAGIVRSIRSSGIPVKVPACILSGGETTVTLSVGHGLGGRNQEFVLAAATKLGRGGLVGVAILSGGTDGEDGPTDAAGAIATCDTLIKAEARGLVPRDFLSRHDSYSFFDRVDGLLKTGPTNTNVMDVRVILVS